MNLKYLLQVVLCSVEKLPILCTPPQPWSLRLMFLVCILNLHHAYFRLPESVTGK